MTYEDPTIRGVLFDSGDTLVRPLGSAWFPGEAFHTRVAAAGFAAVPSLQLEVALQAGMDFLDAHHHVTTVDAEFEQFRVYYDIVLHGCGVPYPPLDLIDALAATWYLAWESSRLQTHIPHLCR